MNDAENAVMDLGKAPSVNVMSPYHESELRRQVKFMKDAARKANRPNGFEPMFTPGFVVKVWNGGATLEINYTVNGEKRSRGMAL